MRILHFKASFGFQIHMLTPDSISIYPEGLLGGEEGGG